MPMYDLSPREQEVSRMVSQGMTTTEIANKLEISPHYVRGIRRSINRKESYRRIAETGSVLLGGWDKSSKQRMIEGARKGGLATKAKNIRLGNTAAQRRELEAQRAELYKRYKKETSDDSSASFSEWLGENGYRQDGSRY